MSILTALEAALRAVSWKKTTPTSFWLSNVTYGPGAIVHHNGGIWIEVNSLGCKDSEPISGNTDWTLVAGTPYVAMQFTPTTHYPVTFNGSLWVPSGDPVAGGIRTLNSIPVDLVVPANVNTFLAPGQCVFVGAQGSGAYSAAIDLSLQYSDASLGEQITANSWDGSVPRFAILADVLVDSNTGATNHISQLGLALQVVGSADVTGGDAPCTIILSYRPYVLSGLL